MNEVFLCFGKRTAIGHHGGMLAMLRPDDMVAQVIDAVLVGADLVIWFAISCADQDAYACRSQARNDRAWQAKAITAATIPVRKGAAVVVGSDKLSSATTIERLAALPAPFRVGGSVTAGNTSGIDDGAAVVLLARIGGTNHPIGGAPTARDRRKIRAGHALRWRRAGYGGGPAPDSGLNIATI
ncbi:MAG: hypothetical protein Q8O82_17790 [Pseudorhodobacter sp.]|nr:hypothetical protein [Pseudorhodobacter sp.]